MEGILDTSVIVRYLVGTPQSQALAARTLIESPEKLIITSVAIAESYHVLKALYTVPRDLNRNGERGGTASVDAH